MDIAIAVVLGLLGLAVGSFLNVCIDRLPAGKSLLHPPSHCDACQRRLSAIDLIPVISYIWLRGRCRYCGARVPVRVFLVELATGLLFTLVYLAGRNVRVDFIGKSDVPAPFQITVLIAYTCVLLILAVIDLEHKRILNIIVYPVAVIALLIGYYGWSWHLPVFSVYIGILAWLVFGINDRASFAIITAGGIVIAIVMDVFITGTGDLMTLASGAIGFVILLLPALVSRSGMGWGDVKMAGLIGFMVGYPRVFVAILGGIILGGVVAIFLIIIKRKTRKDGIAFGPFLALGSFLALMWGQQIIDWYLRLINRA